MATIGHLFSGDNRQRVTQAVVAAERMTAAEIVPVVARASGRYDRAEDIAGLWVGVLLMSLVWWVWPAPEVEPGGWGGPPAVLQLMCMVVALAIGFFLGAYLADRYAPLRRLFAADMQMRDEVTAKARAVFFDQRVHHTTGAGGILIYVSLFEHQATVLADQLAMEKLGAAEIQLLCEFLTSELHKGDITAALCATIQVAGEKLAAVLPRQSDDVNELPDALVLIE